MFVRPEYDINDTHGKNIQYDTVIPRYIILQMHTK